MAQQHDDNLGSLEAGCTEHKDERFEVSVSNQAKNARSHIQLKARWDVPPQVIFSIFTYPDNSKLFRDVKQVGSRRVVKMEPNYKQVEVEQLGELKVLWISRTYSTWLNVTEDARDPNCMVVQFDLMRSDVLSEFTGRWDLRPVVDPASGKVVGTESELNQDVLPRGMPSFLKTIPVMADLLRNITLRAIKRVVQDMNIAVQKIKTRMDKGASVEEALRELCGVYNEQGHANGAVKAFAVDDFQDDDEEEEDEDEKAAAAVEGLADVISSKNVSPGSPNMLSVGLSHDELSDRVKAQLLVRAGPM